MTHSRARPISLRRYPERGALIIAPGLLAGLARSGRRALNEPSAQRAGRSSMSSDAIVVLKTDHKEIGTLFRKFQSAGDNAAKQNAKIVGQIIEAHSAHLHRE
jgi:hypothetical protein